MGMKAVFLIGLAVLSVGAAYAWSRSARLRLRLLDRLETDLHDVKELDSVAQRKAIALTRGDYRRDLHAVMIYLLLATASLIVGLTDSLSIVAVYALLAIPALFTLIYNRNAVRGQTQRRTLRNGKASRRSIKPRDTSTASFGQGGSPQTNSLTSQDLKLEEFIKQEPD